MTTHSSSESFGPAEGAGAAENAFENAQPAGPERVLAVEFIRRMRGASQPFLMRCDDERLYVVKFRNNPQHVRVLANEMLAARLARLIGLPVPDRALVQVPPRLIDGNPLLGFELAGRSERCEPGLQFGSSFPGAPSRTLVVDFLPDRLLRRVRGLAPVFLGAYVLDKWTCNCDGRRVRQLIIDAKNGSMRPFPNWK